MVYDEFPFCLLVFLSFKSRSNIKEQSIHHAFYGGTPISTLEILDAQTDSFPPSYIKNSMTSLLAHTVAQPTKWRFLPKNLNQLVIFVIELEFT